MVCKDYLWDIILNTRDDSILNAALQLLIDVSYCNLSAKLKSKPKLLHPKFMESCWGRLRVY